MAAGLINYIGYDLAAELAKEAQNSNKTLRELAIEKKILPLELLERIFKVSEITKPGIPGK